jgi:hypothetical protein
MLIFTHNALTIKLHLQITQQLTRKKNFRKRKCSGHLLLILYITYLYVLPFISIRTAFLKVKPLNFAHNVYLCGSCSLHLTAT